MTERRHINWNVILVAVIAAIPPSIVGLAAYNKADQTHQLVNSRMTELLELTRKAAKDEATLAEKKAQTVREEAK